jgi:membrane protease subunit (stomatin/prohibitin family)
MATERAVFLEVIEWFDATGREIAHRIPEHGSSDIKYGAQLTVRESQAAVLFYQGKAYDAFPPGRHTLKTANIPILTKIASIPWGMTSPLRAEVVFANMKVFTNMKWGTRDPVAFRDSNLGLVRLRAHGVFNLRVVQPVLFINSLVGTQGSFTTDDVEEYLNRVIVSRFNDHLGEHLASLIDLPGHYEELSASLSKRLSEDFSRFGMQLTGLYINAITPPAEVQQAIDDKSRLGVFDDLGKLTRMKAAMALEKAAESQGEAGAGIGMGLGIMMPAMFADALKGRGEPEPTTTCAKCDHPAPRDARFCPSCGHQQLIFAKCASCAKDLPPGASFCPKCGKPASTQPAPKICAHCGAEELPDAVFCNKCGERLD